MPQWRLSYKIPFVEIKEKTARENRQVESLYRKNYRSIGFERVDLFRCINELWRPLKVLYIGSSIHISPSFIFQNVTYVDNSPLARDFFSRREEVISLISGDKKYKQRPWFEFLPIDYLSAPLPHSFRYDLILSLFAPRTIAAAINCLSRSGRIVHLPLPSDPIEEADRERLCLSGTIVYRRKRYIFNEGSHCNKKPDRAGSYMRDQKFIETNTYSVFTLR